MFRAIRREVRPLEKGEPGAPCVKKLDAPGSRDTLGD